jgi:1-acyl-sn-glycerol-3-phosphate acyltransferase
LGGKRKVIRRNLRLARLALLIVGGAVMAGLLPLMWPRLRQRIIRGWSRQVLAALGVAVNVSSGRSHLQGGLILPNHISWLDIIVLNSLLPARFIAKDEVSRWPVIGWLARQAGTLFVKRGVRREAARLNQRLSALITFGEHVVLFAEGTTTDGSKVLPFHSALLEPAVATNSLVYPAAIRYHTDEGGLDPVPAYIDDCSLFASICAIAGQERTRVDVSFGAAIPAAGFCRRTLAARAHADVLQLLRTPLCLERRAA